MRLSLTALVVLVAAGSFTRAGTLRVATLNVNAGISTCSNTVAAIRNSAADIICLQEPNPRMMSGLTNAFSHVYPYSHLARPGHDYWYYVDRLGILSKYPVDAKFIPSKEDGAFGSQLALVQVGNTRIQILNVHLAPPRLLSFKRPIQSFQEITDIEIKRIAEIRSLFALLTPDLPTLVVGDFNALPASPTINTILKNGFTDTHVSSTNGAGVYTWHDEIEGVPLSARLDYIFHDDSFALITNAVVSCTSSDHDLVFSELELKTVERQHTSGEDRLTGATSEVTLPGKRND